MRRTPYAPALAALLWPAVLAAQGPRSVDLPKSPQAAPLPASISPAACAANLPALTPAAAPVKTAVTAVTGDAQALPRAASAVAEIAAGRERLETQNRKTELGG